jgi:hypothetical protein
VPETNQGQAFLMNAWPFFVPPHAFSVQIVGFTVDPGRRSLRELALG